LMPFERFAGTFADSQLLKIALNRLIQSCDGNGGW
jgi:hypothetical protein